MDRKDVLLAGIDLTKAVGLEIGALNSPLVTKAQGRIHYADYADATFLRQLYANDPEVDTGAIVEVDLIWGERSLVDLANGQRFDFILASHVIEHVPDLVTWLKELGSVLTTGGTIRLAIPDRRFTFGLLRQESALADVVDAYLRKARRPLPRAIFDFAAYVAPIDCSAAWQGRIDLGKINRHYRLDQAVAMARRSIETDEYHDVHCWVFTPTSFVRLMGELNSADLVDLACDGLKPTSPDTFEFFVTLRHGLGKSDVSRSWQEAAVHAAMGPEPVGALRGRDIRLQPVEQAHWFNRAAKAMRLSMRHRGGFSPMLRAQFRAIRDQGPRARWMHLRKHLLSHRRGPPNTS